MTRLTTSFDRFEDLSWLGIPVVRWLAFLGVTVLVFLALWATTALLRRRARAGVQIPGENYLGQVLARTWVVSLPAISAFLTSSFLGLPGPDTQGRGTVEHGIRTLSLVVIFLQAGAWAAGAIDAGLQRGFRYASFSETAARTAYGVVKFFTLMAIWLSVLILILGTFGIEVTPLLAGLGVGGIAVAFALQQILGDIFCSVAIVLDRPFEVGDFVVNGDSMGTVEQIGVKTTRLRSLGGEQIVIPNADLVGSRTRNFKRMAERRVVFSFGVVYSTPPEVLEEIPGIVRSIIESIDQTRFDRTHFASFGDSALNFEVVYYVLTPDYNRHMDIQQAINLALVRELAKRDANFAFPTRTVQLIQAVAADRSEPRT